MIFSLGLMLCKAVQHRDRPISRSLKTIHSLQNQHWDHPTCVSFHFHTHLFLLNCNEGKTDFWFWESSSQFLYLHNEGFELNLSQDLYQIENSEVLTLQHIILELFTDTHAQELSAKLCTRKPEYLKLCSFYL